MRRRWITWSRSPLSLAKCAQSSVPRSWECFGDWDTHGRQAKLTGWRAVFVGIVHGLAGSAALTLLVLTQLSGGASQLLGLMYLLVFGIGSIGGMLLMTTAMSLPLALASAHFERINIPISLMPELGAWRLEFI